MSTAYERERASKKAEKKSKKKTDKAEKDRQQQAKVVEQHNEKLAAVNEASDPVGKLKAWCSKPPYLDLENEIKKACYMNVLQLIRDMPKATIEGPLFQTLDVKEAAILHKYITAANNRIMAGDQGKHSKHIMQNS